MSSRARRDCFYARNRRAAVDIGAMVHIHAAIRAAAAAGASVLLVSSELDEVLMLSHRIAVMHRGRLVTTRDNDRSATLKAALGRFMVSGEAAGVKRIALQTWPLFCALLVAFLCGSLLIVVAGQAPATIYRIMGEGTLGSAYGVGQTLFKATPLIFCGLSVALALRAGLFNVGAEGQLALGAFCAAIVGAALPTRTPSLVAITLCLLAAFIGGAALGALAGALKAYRGAHEVIVTIMLNFIVRGALLGAGRTLFVRETIHSAPIVPAAELRPLANVWPALKGSHVSFALVVAVACCVLLHVVFTRTRAGFAWAIVGRSPAAAAAAGISVKRVTLVTLTLAGGLAGLGAASFVLGYKHYYEDGITGGVGFLGIAVAILAIGEPLGVIASALLFGIVRKAPSRSTRECPKSSPTFCSRS